MRVPVAVWQPCELLYTCYLLTYLLALRADFLWSSFDEIIEQIPGLVSSMILSEVFKYHKHHGPSHNARILFNDMLPSDIEAMTIRLIETGFELIASRLDDHVLEVRAVSGKDALKCLFNVLLKAINDYSYCVDILSTALDSGHETVIRTALQEALTVIDFREKMRKLKTYVRSCLRQPPGVATLNLSECYFSFRS